MWKALECFYGFSHFSGNSNPGAVSLSALIKDGGHVNCYLCKSCPCRRLLHGCYSYHIRCLTGKCFGGDF